MFEYRPDHLAVIYRTDDPHSALTLWTDQGIYFPGLRRDRFQSSESVLPSFSMAAVFAFHTGKAVV